MEENQENLTPVETAAAEPVVATPKVEEPPKVEEAPKTEGAPRREQQQRPPKGERGPRPERGERGPRPENRGGDRGRDNRGGRPQGDRREGRPGGERPGGERRDFAPDIEIDKLISDSLYLDNQAHIVVSRMRDMDSGTRSQLRRLYNAVRRATRAPENERQHEFVMLRARLAYTIARHGLRSLDQLERLLLQVTRKNEARGYERFRDLFEAIVAYNE